MKILILGAGGREHALAWKLRQSPRVTEVYCAPGNGGISEIATCVPLPLAGQEALVAFAKEQSIDLTVVGPDDALAAGIVDRFEAEGLRIFGPVQAAARRARASGSQFPRKSRVCVRGGPHVPGRRLWLGGFPL